ncbi:MAG: GNAT family N-acetyltransferase [Pseudomonadota bacterium]
MTLAIVSSNMMITMVTLEEISRDNIHAVLALDVSDEQRRFYPCSNAVSIAEGHFPPDDDPVWMRAICKDGTPVGFLMTSEQPSNGAYFIWRMMIDRNHQGSGYGGEAMRLLIQRIKSTDNPNVLLLSHLKDNVHAAGFYRSFGFEYTGNDLGGGDLEMALHFFD